jgi:hypothetical protein
VDLVIAVRLLLPLAALIAVLTAACSLAPTSKDQVCASYQSLLGQISVGNLGFGNPLFTDAGDLSRVADRYTGGGLSADAAALDKISGADSTSIYELAKATTHIATLCKKSIATSFFTG